MIENSGFHLLLKALLKETVPIISVDELHQDLKTHTLLDSREPAEFDISHIPSAIFVGYKQFNPESIRNIPKDQPIVIYCSVGVRSEKIGRRLIDMGYQNVKNLYGGIFEWVNCGLPVENSRGRTRDIHAYNRFWSKWITNNEMSINIR
jgi:rhodanese-related sulfurtransferase